MPIRRTEGSRTPRVRYESDPGAELIQNPRWNVRLDVCTLAGLVLSQGPEPEKRARVREPQGHLDRGQRHVLRFAKARVLSKLVGSVSGRFLLRAQSAAVHDPCAAPQRARGAAGDVFGFRRVPPR